MKPKNFPARKLARQIDAASLAEKGESLAGKFEDKAHTGCWHIHESTILPAFTDGGEWRIADQDQHLLDDGWIRHTGDVCPVHELDEVSWIIIDDDLEPHEDRTAGKIARRLRWSRKFGYDDITHYKVIKAYVEPTTFEDKVGDKVFVLNKPYLSEPKAFTPVYIVDGGCAISKFTWDASLHETPAEWVKQVTETAFDFADAMMKVSNK
jgi:hypothetical protein